MFYTYFYHDLPVTYICTQKRKNQLTTMVLNMSRIYIYNTPDNHIDLYKLSSYIKDIQLLF